MGNTGINFLLKYTFYVIDIFKEDKYSDIYDPNVQSGRVLRQPVLMFFILAECNWKAFTIRLFRFRRLEFKKIMFGPASKLWLIAGPEYSVYS
jgi:hypothetical protein